MSEKKRSDFQAKKTFSKSLALIQKSQTSINYNEQDTSKNISTVTELLTEFLTSIMTKDYEQALVYCTEILCTEPKNTTAREFYPLIVEKLKMMENDDSSDSSTTSDSSLSSSSAENIFFNKASGIALKKSEDSLQELSEQIDLEGEKITNDDKNVAISSSVPFRKKFERKNTQMLEYSISYEKATMEEPLLMIKGSNLLVHPTPTITLVQNTVAETKTEDYSNPKEQNQIDNATGKESSHVLFHTSPTITLSTSSSSNEINIENANEASKFANRY